jgi:hypothetical protein
VILGTAASLALLSRAGRIKSPLLLVVFILWMAMPYAALACAQVIAKRWSAPARTLLDCAAILITLGSLMFYAGLISPPAGSPPAFLYVAVPAASTLLAAAAFLAALLMRGK